MSNVSKNPYWTGCMSEDCEFYGEYICGGYLEPNIREGCGHPKNESGYCGNCPRAQMNTKELIDDLRQSAIVLNEIWLNVEPLVNDLRKKDPNDHIVEEIDSLRREWEL